MFISDFNYLKYYQKQSISVFKVFSSLKNMDESNFPSVVNLYKFRRLIVAQE